MKKLNFKNGRISIAEGEGKGKRHELLESDGTEVFQDGEKILIKTGKEGAIITHPEHAQILLPPNDEIEVFIQQEYNDVGEYQKVKD